MKNASHFFPEESEKTREVYSHPRVEGEERIPSLIHSEKSP